MISLKKILSEATVRIKKTISKQEWDKIPKYNKHIGQDGTKYIMQYSDNMGTYLQGVNVSDGKYYVGYNKGRGQGTGVFKDVFTSYDVAKKEVEKTEKLMKGGSNMTAYYVADKDGNPIRESVITEDTRRVKLLGIDFKISEMNGRIFFSFVDKKAASIQLRQIGTNKIVNHIQNRLDIAYGKGTFFFKSGDHAEFQNGYLFQRNTPDINLNKLKFESELKGYLAADVVDDIVKTLGSKMVKGHVENASNRNYIYLKLTDIKFGNDVVKMLKSKFGIDAKVDKTFGNIPTVSFASKKVVSEKKSDYEVYHKSYTSAIEAAREYAEKKGYEINNDDAFTKIGMGPRKPSEGKTNRFDIELSKDGKVQRKKLQIQVYGMRNSYELNAYIQ